MRSAVLTQLVTQERMCFGGEPIVLVGPPASCRGLLRLENPSDNPVKLKSLRLRSAEKLSNCCDPHTLELQLSTKLCARGSAQVQVQLELPAGTPPGRYAAELDAAGGERRPVTIHVLESHRIELSPPSLAHMARAGECFRLPVYAINFGNLSEEIPQRAALELHNAERGWPFQFHAAAKAHGPDGHEPFMDAFLSQIARAEPPPGRTKVLRGAGAIEPQTGRLLELEFRLPAKLRADRSYAGVVRLGIARFQLTLHVSRPKSEPIPAPPDETDTIPR